MNTYDLHKLAGWFRLTPALAPEAQENCAKVCEDAADEIDILRAANATNVKVINQLSAQLEAANASAENYKSMWLRSEANLRDYQDHDKHYLERDKDAE